LSRLFYARLFYAVTQRYGAYQKYHNTSIFIFINQFRSYLLLCI